MSDINAITGTASLSVSYEQTDKNRSVPRPVAAENRGCWRPANQLEKGNSTQSDIDKEKVEIVKRHIDAGTLIIKSDEIADALLLLSQ